MADRAYEVIEKSVAYRGYIVFATTSDEAKRKVLAAENSPHRDNWHEDDSGVTRIVSAKRLPSYDDEATVSVPDDRGGRP